MEDRYWTYALSYDPPQPWHYGTTHFQNIRGEKLRLENPAGRYSPNDWDDSANLTEAGRSALSGDKQ